MAVAVILEQRLDLGADRLRDRAAGPEAAAEGGLIGLGTSPESTTRWRLRPGTGSGFAESSAIVYGCSGRRKLLGRRQLDDLAQVHDGDAVGDVADHGEIVRDEEGSPG